MSRRFVHPLMGITPQNGDKLYFYEPSTTTEKDVYSNAGLSTPIAQPIVANSSGVFVDIFMDSELYRVKMLRAAGTQVYDEDFFDPGIPAGTESDGSVLPIAQGGTSASTAAGARSALGAASASTLTTLSATVSTLDTLVDTGLFDATRFGVLAALDSVSPEQLVASSFRVMVKRDRDDTPAATAITATTPAADDTIPQVGEGTELFSIAYTPIRDDTLIRVRCVVYAQGATDITAVIALFKNGAGDAVAAKTSRFQLQGTSVDMIFEETPGATTPITYSVRIGVAGSTLRINGVGGDDLGTTPCASQTYLEIEEWYTS